MRGMGQGQGGRRAAKQLDINMKVRRGWMNEWHLAGALFVHQLLVQIVDSRVSHPHTYLQQLSVYSVYCRSRRPHLL